MSLTDKINDMITASEASAKCLRDAARDLPARIVSTVMGLSPEMVLARFEQSHDRTISDPGLFTELLLPVAAQDPTRLQPVIEAIEAFVQREVSLDRQGIEVVISGQNLEAYDEFTRLQSQLNICIAKSQEAEHAWRSVKSCESIGRIHQYKARSDLKADMDSSIVDIAEKMKSLEQLQRGLKQEMERQRQDLISAGMMVNAVSARNNNAKLDTFNNQIKLLDSDLGFKKESTYNAKLDIPQRLDEAMKGKQLITIVDSFLETYKHDLVVTRPVLARIGHDLHPDTSVHWGSETYHATSLPNPPNSTNPNYLRVIPTEANNYLGLEGTMKERWINESRLFWTVLVSAFQKAGQQRVLERTLQPFGYGLYGDDSAKGVAGDGILAYWCLLSLTRPSDQVYKDTVATR